MKPATPHRLGTQAVKRITPTLGGRHVQPTARQTKTLRRRRRRCQIIAASLAALLSAVIIFQTACATIVTPPDYATLREPVSIYLIDYHRHSSLMLPKTGAEESTLREYAYGEWGWFAENRTGVVRAVGAMLLPSQGALGRADHPMPASAAELRSLHGFQEVHELRVERELARSLLQQLDSRFESRIDTIIFNPTVGLELVKDDVRYSLGNHCNHATVRWLRAMHVRASPVTAVARFKIRPPSTSPRRPEPDAESLPEL